ncbi:hypothetical protein E2C01_048910 [Portunus trituberculatus]|uniref:Uncharacterized protein n=1 Tax=Portunus trituberculatus TaxID=210409 RepID=A0A5B7GBF0_PORTR|nr:hypothetical protein [Portunus trituberculatus]
MSETLTYKSLLAAILMADLRTPWRMKAMKQRTRAANSRWSKRGRPTAGTAARKAAQRIAG